MSRKLFAIALGCALLAPVTASAWGLSCTPGYWKNHVEEFCVDGVQLNLPRCPDLYTYTAAWMNPDCCSGDFRVNGELLSCSDLERWLNTGGACPDADLDGDPDCLRHDASEFLNSCFVREWENLCPNEP